MGTLALWEGLKEPHVQSISHSIFYEHFVGFLPWVSFKLSVTNGELKTPSNRGCEFREVSPGFWIMFWEPSKSRALAPIHHLACALVNVSLLVLSNYRQHSSKRQTQDLHEVLWCCHALPLAFRAVSSLLGLFLKIFIKQLEFRGLVNKHLTNFLYGVTLVALQGCVDKKQCGNI